MSSNPQAVNAFYTAQTLAYCSFLGLLIPVVGIILGAMSKSRLRMLVGTSEEEQDEIDRVWRIASWGLGISIVLMLLATITIIAWGVLIAQATDTTHQVVATPAWPTDSGVQ